MSNLMNYLDYLPQIPQELLPAVPDIVRKPKIDRSSKNLNNEIFHPKYLDNPELEDWLSENIIKPITGKPAQRETHHPYFRYQVIFPNFPIHIDNFARRAGINYLLHLGGDNVLTQVYDNDQNVLESKKFDLHKWHYLISEMPHNAINIAGIRVAIAITMRPHEEEIFFKSINYTPL